MQSSSFNSLERLLERYNLPVINVTSCAIDIFNNLYITTAKSEKKDELLGGALFYLSLNHE